MLFVTSSQIMIQIKNSFSSFSNIMNGYFPSYFSIKYLIHFLYQSACNKPLSTNFSKLKIYTNKSPKVSVSNLVTI